MALLRPYADGDRRRFWGPLVDTLAVLGLCALGAGFLRLTRPDFSVFIPSITFVSASAEIATAALLAVLYARTRSRSIGFLAVAYAGAGAIALAQAFAVPEGPLAANRLHVAPQVSLWMRLAWHSYFLAAVFAFAWLRTRAGVVAPERARWFLRRVALIVTPAAVLGIATPFVLARTHPEMLAGTTLASLRTSGVDPALFALCLLASYAAMRIANRGAIERALVYAMLAITVEVALSLLAYSRFSAPWYVGRLMFLVGALPVLAAATRETLRFRTQLEAELSSESRRGERHAQRLQTLWRLAATASPDDAQFFGDLLREASPALREGTAFHGQVGHVAGAAFTVDFANDGALGADVPAPGDRIVVRGSPIGALFAAGSTASSRDLCLEGAGSVFADVDHGIWRAFIGTLFRVGAQTHAICFCSITPLAEDFTPADHTYLETLASLCASRLQHRQQSARLQHHRVHDYLTDVMNLPAFLARGESALRGGRNVAVAIADIDGFREINETLGHQSGDAALVHVARVLQSAAPPTDVVARVGGNAFGVLIEEPHDRREVETRLAHYAGRLREPLILGAGGTARTVALSTSFGVALAPEHGTDFEQLLARAETAVRAAKAAGRGGRVFFEPGLEEELSRARMLTRELEDAIATDAFELFFQPHIELSSGNVTGAEALIRWHHPTRGLVAPAEFIPFAEQHGLIERISAWVIRNAIRISAPWRQADPSFVCWVNLSAPELRDPALVDRLCADAIDARGIGIEITETAAMQDLDRTVRTIDALRRAGFRVALDDFGTGYSSLVQLKRLAVDVVKIDKAFVAGIPFDAHDVAIVEAIISIAERYGFAIVAEGVETLAQVAFLAGHGCGYAQGYAYTRPLPAPDFAAWLELRRQLAQSA